MRKVWGKDSSISWLGTQLNQESSLELYSNFRCLNFEATPLRPNLEEPQSLQEVRLINLQVTGNPAHHGMRGEWVRIHVTFVSPSPLTHVSSVTGARGVKNPVYSGQDLYRGSTVYTVNELQSKCMEC